MTIARTVYPILLGPRDGQILRDGEQIGPKQETVAITVFPSHPKSRGSVKLASTDPKDHPAVQFNNFDHPDDMKIMIKGECQLIPPFFRNLSQEMSAGGITLLKSSRTCILHSKMSVIWVILQRSSSYVIFYRR